MCWWISSMIYCLLFRTFMLIFGRFIFVVTEFISLPHTSFMGYQSIYNFLWIFLFLPSLCDVKFMLLYLILLSHLILIICFCHCYCRYLELVIWRIWTFPWCELHSALWRVVIGGLLTMEYISKVVDWLRKP